MTTLVNLKNDPKASTYLHLSSDSLVRVYVYAVPSDFPLTVNLLADGGATNKFRSTACTNTISSG